MQRCTLAEESRLVFTCMIQIGLEDSGLADSFGPLRRPHDSCSSRQADAKLKNGSWIFDMEDAAMSEEERWRSNFDSDLIMLVVCWCDAL